MAWDPNFIEQAMELADDRRHLRCEIAGIHSFVLIRASGSEAYVYCNPGVTTTLPYMCEMLCEG